MPLNNLTNLTPEQASAYTKFLGFLLSNEKEFYLFGKAGSGKTFLTQYLLKNAFQEYKKSSKLLGLKIIDYCIYLTATTHKAAEALTSATGTQAVTVFSLFNIRVQDEENLTQLDTNHVRGVNKSIIFIDECSMLSKEVLQIIRQKSKKSKLVFIGDNYQLPPINEEPHWDNTPENVTVNLTDSVRNRGNKPLENLCSQLRETVKTLQFKKIQLCSGSIENLSDQEILNWLKDVEYPKKVILTYTNEKVYQYIQHFKRFDPDKVAIKEGDIYVLNNTLRSTLTGNFIPPNYRIKITKILANSSLVPLKNGLSIIAYKAHIKAIDIPNAPHKAIFIPKDFKEYQLILNQSVWRSKQSKDWSTYYYLKYEFADLRSSFISTIHKSQGSTYDEVLIDLDSFKSCYDPKVAARLLYVAVSRAKSKVNFYSTFPCRYGEFINESNRTAIFN